MRSAAASLMVVLAACAPRATRSDEELPGDDRMPCLPGSTVRVAPRVEGGLVVVESLQTRIQCEGGNVEEPPVKLAVIRLRPDQPACPIGKRGAVRWRDGVEFESALHDFLATRPERERSTMEAELRRFLTSAQAYVIGCPAGKPVEWLFVEVPEPGRPNAAQPERPGFFDGERVRDYPGQENVVFPDMGAPPLPSGVSAAEYEAASEAAAQAEAEAAAEAEANPPRVTWTGCPGERLDAQWMARLFGSHEQPAPLRWFPGPERVSRWWLRLDGGVATLAYEEEMRPKHGPGAGEWRCSEATTVQGAVTRSGTKLTLTFGTLVAVCEESSLSLPPANAKRDPKPLPQREYEEGCDRYRWATKVRVKTKALVCTGQLPLDALSVFGPPPGIERLALENDCMDASAREALRLVPADGGIAPAL
ncbi:MAG: hypothetical protein AB1730_25995 [Myxococcota bacterium]|jgi:hypothetical protein